MSSTELIMNLRHDVKGTCAQLEAAVGVFEELLEQEELQARELLSEMAEAAQRLSLKLSKLKNEMR